VSILLARTDDPDQRTTPTGTLSPMGTVVDDQVHRLTVEEFEHLYFAAQAAEEPGWDRVELVEGVVYEVCPQSSVHARAVHALLAGFQAALPDHTVMIAGSVRINDVSLWDPDVYVLAPAAIAERKYPLSSEVELAVEVSLTSLDRDLGPKYRCYAAAGIAEYWVLLPQEGGYLLRHRDPAELGYRSIERLELPGGYADLDVTKLLGLTE
jgi:Uma2 family endonuclease